MTIDLHLHTNHSDGTWSPQEMVQYAIKSRMRCIAVTDHDTISGISEAEAAAGGRLEIIHGVEINTNAESGQKKKQDVHILGYFIDKTNTFLLDLLERQRNARLEHVETVIRRLNLAGVPLSLEGIREFTEDGPIGKAHITKAIVAAGGADNIKDAYDKFMSKSSAFYVPRQSARPQQAIEAIRAAGGIASLAHPGNGEQAINTLNDLMKDGLEAVEVYHRLHSVQTVQRLIRFANKHGLLVTGGSDCHGPFEECQPSLGSIKVPFEVVTALNKWKTHSMCAFNADRSVSPV
jgi:predicted metal-dependent phosphoesterase TrpH